MSERLPAGGGRAGSPAGWGGADDPVPAPGDDEEDALLGAQDQAGVELQAVARDQQMDALRGAHVELAALADHVLDVVGPHPGGVDHLPRADPDLLAGMGVAGDDAGHPLALAEEAD